MILALYISVLDADVMHAFILEVYSYYRNWNFFKGGRVNFAFYCMH